MDSQPGGREAVAIARSLWAAYMEGNVDAALGMTDPDCVFVPFTARGQTFTGHDAIRKHMAELAERGVETEARALDFEQQGDWVIVRGYLRRRENGGIAESQLHWLLRIKNGKIARVEAHTRRESAVHSIEAFAAV